MTVHQLLHAMPASEITEWQAFLRLERQLEREAEVAKMKQNVKAGFEELMQKQKEGKWPQ
jgi:hypothetical protein